jgi:hypothetical protein
VPRRFKLKAERLAHRCVIFDYGDVASWFERSADFHVTSTL